ncbi:pyrimidine utilization protein D [Bradyrhizobium sp. dw_78]|uniref:pyrimidine utilization protein D n=1 Tax=Bradyrhizobium sp. dw_78 TaxID=2719793 RepID=UPI001BD58EF8
MNYEAFGRAKTDAPTIVLSAGLGGLGAFWKPQFAALSERFHVIAYDHRGTGANKGALPEGYTIAAMADDVVGILDEAGVGRCHFMGHALGGLIGMELALRAPSRVSGLVLVNAWQTAASPTRRCFAARLALLERSGPEAYVQAQPIFLYPAAWLMRHEDSIAREVAHGIAHFQGVENLMKRVGALLAFDVSARLGEIAAPTLVAGTQDDVLVPYLCSEALASGIPGAKLWLAAEGGHASTVTDPDGFNLELLRFLDETAYA